MCAQHVCIRGATGSGADPAGACARVSLAARTDTAGASSRMPERLRMRGWPISSSHARCSRLEESRRPRRCFLISRQRRGRPEFARLRLVLDGTFGVPLQRGRGRFAAERRTCGRN